MANRWVQARGMVSPVYAGEQQAIEAQLPSVQALYDSLIGGLEASATTGVQNVQEAAGRAGVDRATLAQDTGAMLGDAVQLGAAQLGRQQAGDIGAIQSNLGALQAGQVSATADIENALLNQYLTSQKGKVAANEAKSKYKMDVTDLKRQDELTRQSYANQQARAASSRASSADSIEDAVAKEIKNSFKGISGTDKKVSPADYKEAKRVWVRAGGNASSFDYRFFDFVNARHYKSYGVSDAVGKLATKGNKLKAKPKGK